MDFFQSQDHARRNTKVLIGLFVAAVVCIVALVNLLVLLAGNFQDSYATATGRYHYSPETFVAVSGIVLLLIVLGSTYRILSLAGGGERVAEMMDGQLLSPGTGDYKQRRLLNVVEEMAIAAGTPVPAVYLIPDAAINAFAAGYAPGDAVIGVTRGAIDNLNRDQLQGVIGHEFSHILNGDMRLNIRLMGVLYGILMLSVIGRILLHSGGRRTSRKDSGGAILAIGLGLVVVGYAGLFFGNLIKAAVSRQREFLADASAVQFTRNPDGIGGALMRIGGYEEGSVLTSGNCEEFSHALFSQGVRVMFSSLMATHPPLEERIRRILPRWDGSYHLRPLPDAEPAAAAQQPSALAATGAVGFAIDGERTVGSVGKFAPAHLERAKAMVDAIPVALTDAAREPYSARALAYLILLDHDEAVRQVQLESLHAAADPAVFGRLGELLSLRERIEPRMRLPLLEMAVPSLRQLTDVQYEAFADNIDTLIRADQKIGMSEWALQKFLTRHLSAAFSGKRPSPRYGDFSKVKGECACLLSVLAYADSRGGDPARAFRMGLEKLEFDLDLVERGALDLKQLDHAVDTLAELRPLIKPRLLKACVATIAADGIVTPVEEELVRTIADSLDCPLPPISV